jgi:hypothetical protein
MILSGCLCRNAVEGAFMKIKIITLGILSSLTGVYYLLFDTNNSMGQVGIENFPERARSAISRSTGIPVNFLTVENESDVADTGIKQFKKPLFRSFQLFVDGLDVTAKSQISATRDVPPSYIAIAYNSTISKEGNHQAKAQFRTKDGAIICYKWSFQVTPVKETPELNGTVLSPPSL